MAILRLIARVWTVLLGIALALVVAGLAARWLVPSIRRGDAPALLAVVPQPGSGNVPLRGEIRLRFSQEMNRRSVERALRLDPPVAGRFRWDETRREVAFLPDAPLAAAVTYTLRLDQGAVGRLYTPFAEPFVARFATAPAPVVLAALPADSGAAVTSPIALVFSRPMVAPDALYRPVAVPALSFEPPLSGEARWIDQSTLLFTPDRPLPTATTVRGSLDGSLADANGTPLGQPFSWSFATAAPTLLRNSPSAGAQNVGPQEPLVLDFSQPLAPGEVENGLALTPPISGSITSAISGTGQVVIFTPTGGWQPDTRYAVALGPLRPATGDRPLAPNRWSFTTAPPLTLVGRFPGQGQTLPSGQAVRLIFASAVNTATLASGLRLEPDAGPIRAVGSGAEVRVQANLRASTVYTLTLDQSITDRNGVPLDRTYRLSFVTAPAPPQLALTQGTRRFLSMPADQLAAVEVRRTNLTALDLGLYQLDEATLLRVFGFTSSDWQDFQPERYSLPQLRSWRVPLDDPPGQPISSTLPISAQEPPAPLLPGAYYLRVRSPEGPAADVVLLVSRATLTLLNGSRQSLVWASDGAGAPIADLPLALYAGSSVVARGRSDGNGLWLIDRPAGGGPFLVLAEGGQPADAPGAGAVVSSEWPLPGAAGVPAERGSYRIGLAIDRSAYRPDGAILVGGFVRALDAGRVAAPTLGTTLDLSLRRVGTTDIVTRTSVRLDRSGVVSSSLALAGVAPGSYLLRAVVGDSVRDLPLAIASNNEQPFVVRISTTEGQQATISATTATGEPLVGAQVSWRITGVPVAERSPLPVGIAVGDDEGLPGAGIDQGGGGTTGDDGRLTIPLPTDGLTTTQQLRITAEVAEGGGARASGETSLVVQGSDLVIGLRAEAQAAVAPATTRVELFAIGRDGRAAAETALQVDVLRRTWEPDLRERRVSRSRVETDAQGRATVALDLRAGGEYRIVATGRDGSGRTARSATSLWVAPASGVVEGWQDTPGGLLLVPDQQSYTASATAGLLVGLPRPEARLLVAVERGGVLTATLRTLRAGELLPVAIPNGQASGDATVTTLLPDGPPGAVGRAVLRVEEPAPPLVVAIDSQLQPGGADNSPGQTATLTVTVRDGAGVPVNSDLLVAVTPEGETPLATIDLDGLTRAQRPPLPGVARTTARSAGVGGNAGAQQGRALNLLLPPAADHRAIFWRGGLRTGPDGTLVLEVALPPGAARWRVSALAGGDATLFGQGSAVITATQPLVAQAVVPAALTVGDGSSMGLELQNSGATTLALTATVATDRLALTEPPTQTVELAAGARELLLWQGIASSLGPSVVTFTLQSANSPTAVLTRALEIRPGRTQAVGETLAGPVRFTRPITGAVGRLLALDMALAPSYAAAISSSQEWLLAQRGRSIEQEASLLGLSSILQQTAGFSGTARLRAALEASAATLLAAQRPDGGWGWWSDTATDPFITGYVLEMWSYAAAVGDELPAEARERALAALAREVRRASDPDLHAYLLYVLARYGQGQSAAGRDLLGRTTGRPLGADGLAYLALMLPPEGASSALDRLAALAQRGAGDEVFWLVERAGPLPQSSVGTTALALRAFERGRPESPLVAGARRAVGRAWGLDGWPTAYESTRAAAALGAGGGTPSRATGPVSVTASLGGERLLFPKSSPTATVRLHQELGERSGLLEITVAGGQGGELPLVAYRLTSSGQQGAGNGGGLALTRSYHDPLTGNTLDEGALRRGQLVRVQLTLVVASPQSFVTLHEPRSAALEAVAWQPNGPFEHAAISEEGLAWGATRLTPGIYTQGYLARVGQPGNYGLPPARVAPAYTPDREAIGPAQRAVVR